MIEKFHTAMRTLGRDSADSVEALSSIVALFDRVPDILFFVKDRRARYVAVSQTIVSRCQLSDKASAIGRMASELFPGCLGRVFDEQDQSVLSSGTGFHDRLELHLYADGREGWCVSYKEPVVNSAGEVTGLCGLSRDLRMPGVLSHDLEGVSVALHHIQQHFDESIRLPELASLAGLSVYQLNERIRSLFGVTVGQYLVKVRVDAGCRMLALGSEPIVEIALACGYSDQPSFTRQFKQVVGLTPAAYRRRALSSGSGPA